MFGEGFIESDGVFCMFSFVSTSLLSLPPIATSSFSSSCSFFPGFVPCKSCINTLLQAIAGTEYTSAVFVVVQFPEIFSCIF